jgi:DNA modification methylase
MTYTLHLGDCLEYMRTMPAGSVDAVITDPPYGLNYGYSLYDDTPENLDNLISRFIPLSKKYLLVALYYLELLQCLGILRQIGQSRFHGIRLVLMDISDSLNGCRF